MDFKLEICVDSVESALIAQEAGADRIELCSNLIKGGTTPGYGTIVTVRNNLTIDLNVIIRPRGGDFLYNDQEYEIMRRDIEICGESDVDGVVLGILTRKGEVDVDRTAKLIEFAHPMKTTFHRAFDMCNDPFKGLDDVIAAGAQILLTSGMKNKASEGNDLIRRLIEKAGNRIIVMPGSGISDSNIEALAKMTGAKEFHLTGRRIIQSEMIFRKEDIHMGGLEGISEYSRKVADKELIGHVISILKKI